MKVDPPSASIPKKPAALRQFASSAREHPFRKSWHLIPNCRAWHSSLTKSRSAWACCPQAQTRDDRSATQTSRRMPTPTPTSTWRAVLPNELLSPGGFHAPPRLNPTAVPPESHSWKCAYTGIHPWTYDGGTLSQAIRCDKAARPLEHAGRWS